MATSTPPPPAGTRDEGGRAPPEVNPWPALFALCLGFFMILVDSTIVSVATPAIIADLQADVNSVVWVTSAYLLAYAVPVLITGRLGDRYGPKNLYLLGLTVFTLSSLWCGLTGSVEGLIVARVFQGLGAAMITPQTMAIITRIFPAERRGQAMALWGATAGVATLVGPILGGVLVDALGWEWIFFINIPVGIVGFVLAWRLVPSLPTNNHRFDWLGRGALGRGDVHAGVRDPGGPPVRLGHDHRDHLGAGADRRRRRWCSRCSSCGRPATSKEPLVPLSLFRDRNFSLANVAISAMGCAITAMAFPIMLYAQLVRGLSPTGSALLLVPMALMSIVLAPWVGKLTDAVHPRLITSFGFASAGGSLLWLSQVMTADSATWEILLPMVLLGIGNAFVWAPTSATATRNLPMHQAGAGAGIYNATRQVGAVLGSAAIAVLMDSRLAAQGLTFSPSEAGGGNLPQQVFAPFAEAMSQAMLLPAGILLDRPRRRPRPSPAPRHQVRAAAARRAAAAHRAGACRTPRPPAAPRCPHQL